MGNEKSEVRFRTETPIFSRLDIYLVQDRSSVDPDLCRTACRQVETSYLTRMVALRHYHVALEGIVVYAALLSISRDLGGGQAFIWVPNAYFSSSYVRNT